MESQSLKKVSQKAIKGIFALASRSLILQFINFGAFLTISIILSAKELGIYTAVVAIQRVISFFTDFGLGAALIQKKENLEKKDLTTVFTIQFLITLGIFLIFLVLLGDIKQFFGLDDKGGKLLSVLVFTIFLSSFKMIPSIILERNISFGKLVIPQIVESLIFNLILIFLVLRNFGVDSYTWAFLISSISSIPLYYYISPWRPSIGVYRSSISNLKFGIQFQAKNILAAVKDDFLTVILTKFLTFAEIGYLGFSQRIAFFVYRYIVDSVTKVTFSSYSRMQEDKDYLRKAIEKSLFFTTLIIFPLLFGLIATSPFIIQYFPGWSNKWEPALISVIFFSLNAVVSSMSSVLVNVLDATGKVKTTLKLMIMWTFMTWILTPVFIYLFGFSGVAIASFVITLSIVITIYLVKKVLNFDFIKSIYKQGLSSIVMILALMLLGDLFISDLLSLFFVIILGGVIYLVCITIMAGKGILKDIKNLYH